MAKSAATPKQKFVVEIAVTVEGKTTKTAIRDMILDALNDSHAALYLRGFVAKVRKVDFD